MNRSLITLDASGSEWLMPPWPVAFELARLLPAHSWTLVGGLMVQMHATIAGLPAGRATVDVDSTLHLETGAVGFAQAASLLSAAGFTLDPNTTFAYLFRRGPNRIDLLCTDRYAAWRKPTFSGRPLFGIAGGTRALRSTINVNLATQTDTVNLVVPELQGALVLKGGAYLEDQRDRDRHLEDAIMLFACATEPHKLLVGLSAQSRRRILALVRALEAQRTVWATADPGVASLAREALPLVRPS